MTSFPIQWILRKFLSKLVSKKDTSGAPMTEFVFQTRAKKLAIIEEELGDCQKCPLCETRKNLVFGEGFSDTEIVFVGEGPGADEDEQGRPFVGRAGKLLERMIKAMGYEGRQSVYICNVLKCRPPENRYPTDEEVVACFPTLVKQLQAISPKVIVTLGNLATQTLLGVSDGITSMRGKWQTWNGLKVMPTYHPAYALRDKRAKKPMWRDMMKVLRILGRNPRDVNVPGTTRSRPEKGQ